MVVFEFVCLFGILTLISPGVGRGGGGESACKDFGRLHLFFLYMQPKATKFVEFFQHVLQFGIACCFPSNLMLPLHPCTVKQFLFPNFNFLIFLIKKCCLHEAAFTFLHHFIVYIFSKFGYFWIPDGHHCERDVISSCCEPQRNHFRTYLILVLAIALIF